MSLTVYCKRLPDEMEGGEDDQGRRSYRETYEIDQTDAGPLAAPVAMAAAAQAVNDGPDLLPLRGDAYSYAGTTDLDAFVLSFGWKRPQPTELKTRLHVTVNYGAATGTAAGRLAEPNPLYWPTEYWLEWFEEQIPVTSARNVEELISIGRAPFTDGPIVNAAGEETVDPITKTIRYPILCAQKAYATLEEIVAVNTTYQDSTNISPYFGADPRQAAYVSTESGRIQQTQGHVYYLGVTKIWFKKLTWDLRVLNRGFNCFLKDNDGVIVGAPFITDEAQRFRCMVQDITGFSAAGVAIKGDFSPSSEPLKLDLDGLVLAPGLPAVNLTYREREELDYGGIGIGGS